jgi:ubiquitin-protein ligase
MEAVPADDGVVAAVDAAPKIKYQSQTMKDYALMIEYKHLAHYAPGGVYVLPSYDNLRVWYGVIFLRRGSYGAGIFRFRYNLPEDYPGEGTRPTVTFLSRVFHPLIHPEVF